MLFPARVLAGLQSGTVDRAFRRWERPRVRAGGSQRTAIGVIGFDSVVAVRREELGEDDARRAGFASLDALLAFIDRRADGAIYRIRLRLVGPDPRVELREALPDDAELGEIQRRLERLDRASRHGPWTHDVLSAIRDQPGVPAAELAAGFGREKLPFKVDVRKLKELGLTESLRPGYRLSPRGASVVARLAERR
ncbi:MAG TPA: hypothetical protein VF365_09610 [Candidatus Limnocylindria bacterium]